jgi:hypothetical protein
MEQKDYNKIIECLAMECTGWSTEDEFRALQNAREIIRNYGQMLIKQRIKKTIEEDIEKCSSELDNLLIVKNT